MSNRVIKRRILEFIAEYSSTNIVSPSYREIGSAVGLKSPSSVGRYIEQLKAEGMLASINQKGRAIALARKIELYKTASQPQRVCLEVADGGVVFFDCNLEKKQNDMLSVSFSGIFDASQLKGRVGQVVNCRLDDS